MKTEGVLSQLYLDSYGQAVCLVSKDLGGSVLCIENETGMGTMTRVPVFPGVDILYNDMHLAEIDESQNMSAYPRVMEINHCREGRFECEFADGAGYLGPGDLVANMLTHPPARSWFPLSHYHGISVMVALDEAQEAIDGITRAMGSARIDLDAMRENLCRKEGCGVIRAASVVQHIFSEMYEVPPGIGIDYFRLKVMELFMFCSGADLSGFCASSAYLTKAQARTVREICAYIWSHLDERLTLPSLSRRFGIPLTTMKQRFRIVYGVPIGAYVQELRIQKARQLLVETADSIADIALQVGYHNPSKFADAFRRLTGHTPSELRKNACPIGSSGALSE